MVNEQNLIPKTETVYEIKDEYKVPSFEEFMKTYEGDGNLNYDDLSGGDVGENKGYGPCDICYKETRWINLKISCPASGCNNNSIQNWTHTPGCGSILQISNKNRIRCSGCSLDCRMKDYTDLVCSGHHGTYAGTSYDSFTKSLTLAFGFHDGREKKVLKDLFHYLFEHEW